MPPVPPPQPETEAPSPSPSPNPAQSRVDADLARLPEGEWSVSVVRRLADVTSAAMKSLVGKHAKGEIPEIEVPEGEAGKIRGVLPASVMFPVFTLTNLIAGAAGPEFAARYACEPSELVDDAALKLLIGKVKTMGSDGKVKKAIEREMTGAGPEKEAEPPVEEPAPMGAEMRKMPPGVAKYGPAAPM